MLDGRVYNVPHCLMARSQNADRTAMQSIDYSNLLALAVNNDLAGSACPTLTPSGCFWLRKAKRIMLGEERLAMQGIVHYSRDLTQHRLSHLAGEAMCAGSSTPTIISAEGCL